MIIRLFINLVSICLLLSFSSWSLYAQDPEPRTIEQLNSCFDKTYGLDQKLISGIQYYNNNPRALGNEFFGNGEFAKGRLIVNGREYNNVKIRYDIYNQRINLHFNYDSSAANTVIIEKYKVDEFELEDMLFRKYFFPGYDTLFYQVVAEGRISSFYFWYKNLTLQTSLRNVYEYSEPRRKFYLMVDSNLFKYTGLSTFIKLFDENKPEVRKYIRENQIRLRNAPDHVVKDLIIFCNSLMDQAGEE